MNLPGLTVDTCGSCKFWDRLPTDLTSGICKGVPPTPVIVGASAQGINVQLLRANLPSSEAACALHRPRAAVLLRDRETTGAA